MKKISALIAAAAIAIGIIPSVYADNSDYIGFFKATDADGVSFAELNILTCDEDSFTISFKRVKNEIEKIKYEFDEGTINEEDNSGSAKFTATLTSSGATLPGTATLSFINEELVKITCISYQDELFYEGIMKRSTDTPSTDESDTPATDTDIPVSDNVNISINGKKMEFSSEIKPRIINDSTYIPLRSILSNIGINVYWDEYDKNEILREQLITCTKNKTILQFSRTLNSSGANTWTLKKWENSTTNTPGENIDIIYLQPVLIENSSYIPLRIVSESFGAEVIWEAATRTVLINCDATNEYLYDSATIGKMEDFTQEMAQTYLTSDFTSIIPYKTPYFAPQGKFYNFDAQDQWNEISLRIFMGGYIDVVPRTAETQVTDTNVVSPATEETVATTDAPAETDETVQAEEIPTSETVNETVSETPVEAEPSTEEAETEENSEDNTVSDVTENEAVSENIDER